ncbi:MAG TPA: Gldg family protein, partial [Methyloceanibacter sp.]|nr:Gldg family protein [Methyloceanibacter sp.]
MPSPHTSFREKIGRVWNGLVERGASLSRPALAWGSLGLAAVILLSVNLISSVGFRDWQADMTEERLFTISPGTREVLRNIDEPIALRFYFSKKLGEASPAYARYFARVQRMLDSFRALSGGKLEVSYFDPEPFSPEEDQAVAAGLRKVAYNAEGDVAYFGLTGTNSTDNRETIEFFYPDRETFVEYDITKLIHSLAHPKKPVIGVITGLPLDGERNPVTRMPGEPWLIMQQIRELFDVRTLEQNIDTIPAGIDVLLIAQPNALTPGAAYAIDQYMLGGGRAVVLIDPVAEVTQFGDLGESREGIDELAKLLKAWGIEFDRTAVAADINHAQRVRFGRSGETVTDYVAWLGLDARNIDRNDVLAAGIETLNFATPGILKPVAGAGTKIAPIVRTSSDAMQVALTDVGVRADPIKLLQEYKPGGKPFILVARISGEAKSAFPGGPPDAKKDAVAGEAAKSAEIDGGEEAAKKPQLKSGSVNAIVIADTDMMADRFWVEERDLLGQSVVVPTAQNAALVIGALENLAGSDALIALRGRGVVDRPFTWVEDLRRNAERKFREKEQKLTQRLQELQTELAKLETPKEGVAALSAADTEAVNKFKAEMLKTRRELRDVKLALRRDIDRLDGWLKFANIALVPLLIGIGG